MQFKYFNLTEEPFGVTANPRFLYMSQQHLEAAASLAYGTETNRGFLALIAKPGMGKTSLLYQYLEWLRQRARTAFIFRTDCDSREFMGQMMLDLGIDASGRDFPAMHEALNNVLLEEMKAGRRLIVVIDEAQNLDEKVLESVRLLSNFETPMAKLIQIVLAGQPQLAEKLAKPSLAQLRQRISLIVRIEPFSPPEVNRYIDHRLRIAGCTDVSLFDEGARLLIAERSQGIPRNINNLCFLSMGLACALKRPRIDREIVLEVLADLNLESMIEDESASPVNTVTGKTRENAAGSLAPAAQATPSTYKSSLRKFVPRAAATIALVLAAVTCADRAHLRTVSAFETAGATVVHEAESMLLPTAKAAPLPVQAVAPWGVTPDPTPDSAAAKPTMTTKPENSIAPVGTASKTDGSQSSEGPARTKEQ
jgi:general secretion pathway protein A